MKPSSSTIISVCANVFKFVSTKNRVTRFLSSSSALEDRLFSSDEESISCLNDSDFSSVSKNTLPERAEKIESSGIGRNHMLEFVDEESSISDYRCVAGNNDELLEQIKSILLCRGWNVGSQNSYGIHLGEYSVIQILNAVYEESSDCNLALHFFNRLVSWTGTNITLRSICTMIHILISGNMNHKAVKEIMNLVRMNTGEDWWVTLMFKAFHETHTERVVLVTAYSMLVDCLVKESMTQAALKLIGQMKQLNFFPSYGVCNSLIYALLRLNWVELAWDLLQEVQNQGMGLNASIFSLFIHKYCISGDLRSGWELLIKMRNYGIDPDVVSYTILIDSLCKMSFVKEAMCILFKIIEMGMSVDSICVSPVIDSFCKMGKLEVALLILRISSVPPNIYIYNSFISQFCTDNMAAAAKIFHQMSEVGFHPDCFIHTTMIGGYCKISDIKSSLNYLGKMLKKGIKPSIATYTMLISSYCKSGDIASAELLFQNAISEGLIPDLVAYNTLMDGYGKKGHLHKVFGLLDVMKSYGISPDTVTYNTVIHCLVNQGFLSEAKEVLDELVRRGFPTDVVSFTDIANGLSQKGDFKEAFFVWLYMGEIRIKPDVVMCNAFVNGYCRARRMDEALALFHKMLDAGLIPDRVLYNTLIHGFCYVGNISDACSLVNMMVKNGIRPDVATHKAFVLGYERKWMVNPIEAATNKLQQILREYDRSTGRNLHLRDIKPAC